jgi:DNA polymerase-3 subunit epsilon
MDGFHDAVHDAVAAARLAWRLSTLPDLQDREAGELHDLQIDWAAEQSHGLREYFRKQGNEDWRGVRDEWPTIPRRPIAETGSWW